MAYAFDYGPDHEIKPDPALLESRQHLYEMMGCLLGYGENFEWRDGRLLIEKDLAADTETLANFNNKCRWVSIKLLDVQPDELRE